MTDTINTPILLLTPDEAAKALAISPRTLRNMASRGDIDVVRIDRRGTMRFTLEALETFVADRIAGKPRSKRASASPVDRPGPTGLSSAPVQRGGRGTRETADDLKKELRSWRR